MIGELHLTTEDELNRSPNPSHHQNLSQLLSDALQCLSVSETSLSPKVHGILMGGKDDLSSEEKEKPLLSDGTLNWPEISKYFDISERK